MFWMRNKENNFPTHTVRPHKKMFRFSSKFEKNVRVGGFFIIIIIIIIINLTALKNGAVMKGTFNTIK